MRGIRDKIKDTKTKLLRRDSRDSTEEAAAIRPAKSARSTTGSWGRKSRRQSIGGTASSKDPSRSDQSLDSNDSQTVLYFHGFSTNKHNPGDPRTPISISGGRSDEAIERPEEAGVKCKRFSGTSKPLLSPLSKDGPSTFAPLLTDSPLSSPLEEKKSVKAGLQEDEITSSPLLSSLLTATTQTQPQSSTPTTSSLTTEQPQQPPSVKPHHHHHLPTSPTTLVVRPGESPSQVDASLNSDCRYSGQHLQSSSESSKYATTNDNISSSLKDDTVNSPISSNRRNIPTLLLQKDSSDSKSTLLGSDANEGKSHSALSQNKLAESGKPTSYSSPAEPVPSSSSASSRLYKSETPELSPVHSPVNEAAPSRLQFSERPYRLVQNYTDSSGRRTDTDRSSLLRLRQDSSRTSLSVHDSISQEAFEVPDNEVKDFEQDNSTYNQNSATSLARGDDTLIKVRPSSTLPPNNRSISEENDREISGLQVATDLSKSIATVTISPGHTRRKAAPSFPRRQSLIHSSDTGLLQSLLEQESSPTFSRDSASTVQLLPVPLPYDGSTMRSRRVWVKRPGGSPTQVVVAEDDVVDTLRDLCLRKYANSLGRQFDSPDLFLRIVPASKPQSARLRTGNNSERLLNPDESLTHLLDSYYPNGQSADDALLVEIPRVKTPRPSPGHSVSYTYGMDMDIPEQGYFPPIGVVPVLTHSQANSVRGPLSMTGPPTSLSTFLPTSPPPSSPGHPKRQRPQIGNRMPTASPVGSNASSGQNPGGVMLIPRGSDRVKPPSEAPQSPIAPPPMSPIPSPGLAEPQPQRERKADSPSPMTGVVAPPPTKPKPPKKVPASIGTLDGQVPAINVLIVEDNIINLKLLEAFMKRLKVRWQTAMNGRDAVTKWRTGGFHLVLMDIQLPIMNGLDATKEIRRLERLNGIGSFSSNPSVPTEEVSDADKLDKSVVFKGSVIIVALTASSLQSDRHEALAVGCNDFLTKPVNFDFLERKVMEWGCMQALIDFEGWRKWKDLASKPNPTGKKGAGARTAKVAVKSAASAPKDSPVVSDEA